MLIFATTSVKGTRIFLSNPSCPPLATIALRSLAARGIVLVNPQSLFQSFEAHFYSQTLQPFFTSDIELSNSIATDMGLLTNPLNEA